MIGKATAVFDIGKTNKKFILFDADYSIISTEYKTFKLIEDDNGNPCEDIDALLTWMKSVFAKALQRNDIKIVSLNFSSYGASLIHLDEKGKRVTPLYDYANSLPENIKDLFLQKYGPKEKLYWQTGIADLGMLNSGMQLFWLKYERPEIYKRIRTSLHLPQYFSYVFSGKLHNEYTSIGCHTGLWDYTSNDYHEWVKLEGFTALFPPICSSRTYETVYYEGQLINIGVGIHDSSASLLPYTSKGNTSYILISTGTWSVALNPGLDKNELPSAFKKNTLFYMGVEGAPVLAKRFYLGREFSLQLDLLLKEYNVDPEVYKTIAYDSTYIRNQKSKKDFYFKWRFLDVKGSHEQAPERLDTFEEAYHQLVYALALIQLEKLEGIADLEEVKEIYIEGGFANNEVFVGVLRTLLGASKVKASSIGEGSALGAALVISQSLEE